MEYVSLTLSVIIGLWSGVASYHVSRATRVTSPGAYRRAASLTWWLSGLCFVTAVFRGIIGAVWLGLFSAACWVLWLVISRWMRELGARSASST